MSTRMISDHRVMNLTIGMIAFEVRSDRYPSLKYGSVQEGRLLDSVHGCLTRKVTFMSLTGVTVVTRMVGGDTTEWT